MGKNVSKMETRRIFAAVDISDEVRSAIRNYINEQRLSHSDLAIRWERIEKLHITLKFLAEADDRQATAMDKALSQVAAAHLPFDAEINGIGVFPNIRSPRILWLGVGSGESQIKDIAGELESICRQQGIASEKRPFHPHVTLGRIRPARTKSTAARNLLQDEFSAKSFRVERLTLYESSLSPTGSTYSVLSTYTLSGLAGDPIS